MTSSSHQYCLSNTETEIIFPENLSQSEDLVAEESIWQLASAYSFATCILSSVRGNSYATRVYSCVRLIDMRIVHVYSGSLLYEKRLHITQ